MKVRFDNDGYVEMLIYKGELTNSIELPDDDTINMAYLSCYKLGYEGTQLVLDANKVQRIEGNSKAASLIYNLKKDLDSSDYKVLRHIRETALGIKTTLTPAQYFRLEAQRESLVRQIREIEQGTSLETDVNAILNEGMKASKKIIEKEVEKPIVEVVEEKPKKKTTKKTTTKKKSTKKDDTEE